MRNEELPLELLKRVNPRSFQAFVEGLGWQRVEKVRGPIAVYSNPANGLRQVTIPLDEQLDDYADAVSEALRKIAESRQQPVKQIFEQVLLPIADIFELREVSSAAESGTLPLTHASDLIDGIRKMLLSMAHSVLVPQPFHPRLSRNEAERFVASCRFGQTDRGSFTLRIACPLDRAIDLFENEKPPFGRQVTTSLIESLQRLAELANRSSHDLKHLSLEFPLLSANFCEALLMLRPVGEHAYQDLSVCWSNRFAISSHETRTLVRLRQDVFDLAESLAPVLRSKPTPSIHRFFGFVVELRGSPTPDEPRPSGEVRFKLLDQDEEIYAKADLGVEDYAKAIAAHAVSAFVTFRGILHRLPRLNRIEKVEDFKQLEDDFTNQRIA